MNENHNQTICHAGHHCIIEHKALALWPSVIIIIAFYIVLHAGRNYGIVMPFS